MAAGRRADRDITSRNPHQGSVRPDHNRRCSTELPDITPPAFWSPRPYGYVPGNSQVDRPAFPDGNPRPTRLLDRPPGGPSTTFTAPGKLLVGLGGDRLRHGRAPWFRAGRWRWLNEVQNNPPAAARGAPATKIPRPPPRSEKTASQTAVGPWFKASSPPAKRTPIPFRRRPSNSSSKRQLFFPRRGNWQRRRIPHRQPASPLPKVRLHLK